MTDVRAELVAQLDAIERELDRRYPGMPEPTAQQIAEGGAFGLASMAFAQWLRFVFVPIARQRIAERDLPASSSVAAQAVREFDGDDSADELVSLLARFDEIVEGT